jgi:hypothetical protein
MTAITVADSPLRGDNLCSPWSAIPVPSTLCDPHLEALVSLYMPSRLRVRRGWYLYCLIWRTTLFIAITPFSRSGLRDMFIFSFQVCLFIIVILLAYSSIFIYFLGMLSLLSPTLSEFSDQHEWRTASGSPVVFH